MYQIRTYNAISAKGLDRFDAGQFSLGEDIAEPHAFILRSKKLHEEPIPDSSTCHS